jgi:hypothetical protein
VSRRQTIAAVAAGVVIVAVLIVGVGLGWLNPRPSGGPPPAQRLAVATTLEPRPAFYGDLLTAQIDVHLNAAAVSEQSVRVLPSFDPYVETGAPEVTRTGIGAGRTISYRYSIQCVSGDCLPLDGKPYVLRLQPVTVTARAGTQTLRATATWPQTFIVSRLSSRNAVATVFRWQQALPAMVYGVSPTGLAGWLTIAAGVLGLAALALIGYELVRLAERRRERAQVALTPLQTALAYTRDAAGRPDPADRRRALGLLARTLDREGSPVLAGAASDVAWSEEPPSSDRALELADEVETTAGGDE